MNRLVWSFGLYLVMEGALRGSWGVPDVVSTRPIYHENCFFLWMDPFKTIVVQIDSQAMICPARALFLVLICIRKSFTHWQFLYYFPLLVCCQLGEKKFPMFGWSFLFSHCNLLKGKHYLWSSSTLCQGYHLNHWNYTMKELDYNECERKGTVQEGVPWGEIMCRVQ